MPEGDNLTIPDMSKLPHQSAIMFRVLLILMGSMILFACTGHGTPPPALTPGPAPSLTAREAIDKIELYPFPFPYSEGDAVWNASYNPSMGRWEVTKVRRIRGLYTSSRRRLTSLWYVTDATGEVAGPFLPPPTTSPLLPWRPASIQ
jgi:hypothetical protein